MRPAQAVNGGAGKAEGKKAWSLDVDTGDEELVDDDELLTEEDLQRPAPGTYRLEGCCVSMRSYTCRLGRTPFFDTPSGVDGKMGRAHGGGGGGGKKSWSKCH